MNGINQSQMDALLAFVSRSGQNGGLRFFVSAKIVIYLLNQSELLTKPFEIAFVEGQSGIGSVGVRNYYQSYNDFLNTTLSNVVLGATGSDFRLRSSARLVSEHEQLPCYCSFRMAIEMLPREIPQTKSSSVEILESIDLDAYKFWVG